MLDTSRNYFSIESIKRTLVGMAHSKLNRFHWHITDSQSFPYVSKNYPQMAEYGAYSSKEVYTPEDVRDVAEFARVRGIQVVPEIDAPAHAGNGWDWGPKYGLGELSLCINQQPWSFYCGKKKDYIFVWAYSKLLVIPQVNHHVGNSIRKTTTPI